MAHVYGVLGMPRGDLASKQAIKTAGCTHTVIVANWSQLQPNGPGIALDPTQLALLTTDFAQAKSVGLKVLFEFAIHYAPSWALTGTNAIESFVDQNAVTYDGALAASGKQVANWMWTTLGRTYVQDFVNKVAAGIGVLNLQYIDAIKTGGGYYGELHYPPANSGTGNSFQGFGISMQSGTGLASDQVVCPLAGYIPFNGGSDANDSIWINWYIDGLVTWVKAFIAIQRTAGFAADFHVCCAGYGIRSDNLHSDAGYQQSAALGEDPVRFVAYTATDSQVWPYSTWLDTSDGFSGGTNDTDMAAWKKIYSESLVRNKYFRLWGENTGGESTSGLQNIFSGYQYGSALSIASYAGAPAQTYGFQGLFWLSYDSLTAGGSNASLSDLATAIAANP
jgi:hypothetical protein